MTFDAVPMLDTAAPLEERIATFVESDALAALLRVSGIAQPPAGPLRERLARMAELSEVWDERRGNERDQITAKEFGGAAQLVSDAADALGLVRTRPARLASYDHLVILSGLVRACFTRSSAAARLLDDGVVSTDSVTALGGFRKLSETERALASSLGFAGLDDEVDALEVGVRRAFRLGTRPLEDYDGCSGGLGSGCRVRRLRARPLPGVSIVAAPSSRPGVRRATTVDALDWFATRQAGLGSRSIVLLVTSAIYAPYQHAHAIRLLHLRYGSMVDTIGVAAADIEEPLRKTFGPQEYLQEVRSTLRAYRRLLESLPS